MNTKPNSIKGYLSLIFLFLSINTIIGQVSTGLKVVKKYYDWPKNTRLEEIYTINSIGQKQGTYKWYNIFSVTTSPEHEGVYKNDMLDGPSKRYYTFTTVSLSGIVKESREYKAGKLNGKEIYYDYVYNGEYASNYKYDNEVVPFIQKGKRVIREELDYSNDVLLAKKTYHANGKNAINQKFDIAGELLSEVITNEEGVVTYENRFDDDGNFVRKFKLFPNGKINILNEKDSNGGFSHKEYYETGIIKSEKRLDKMDKVLSETYYASNGNIERKTVGLKEEIFFEDGSLKELTTKNANGDIIENIVYKSPNKLEIKYVLNSDGSTDYQKFDDNNKYNYRYIVDKSKNSLKITVNQTGGYTRTRFNSDKENLGEESYDAAGKLLSKVSTKSEEGVNGNNITTQTTYDNKGGYVERVTVNSPYATQNNVLRSIKEVDSTGAYKLIKYNNGAIKNQSRFDNLGRIMVDSSSESKIEYDTTGNKIYQRKNYSNGSYEEFKYQSDGTIRYRIVSNNSAEKYPPESILSKFSQSWQKNIKLGTIYFDNLGNKIKLIVYDAAGDIIKEIKIKDNDETQYFIHFLKVS
jgi:hypothetical protein